VIKRVRLYLNENKDNYGYSKIISFIKNQMPTEYYKLICDIVGIKDSGFGKEKLEITENMVSKWIRNKDLYSDPRGPKPVYNKKILDRILLIVSPCKCYMCEIFRIYLPENKQITYGEYNYTYSYNLQKWRLSIMPPILVPDYGFSDSVTSTGRTLVEQFSAFHKQCKSYYLNN